MAVVAAAVAAGDSTGPRPATSFNSVTSKIKINHAKFLEIIIGLSGLIQSDDVPI